MCVRVQLLFFLLVFSLGVDVRMKPFPTLPSPLQDAPSWLRSSFLISVRVLLVLLSPVCKNKVSKIFTGDTLGSLV